MFQQGSFLISGDPMSPGEVERKRAIAQKLMRGFGRAQNVGEGVGDLLMGVGMGVQNRRLAKSDAANLEKGNELFSSLFAPSSGGGMASTQQAPQDTPEQAYAQSRVEQAFGGNPAYRDAIAGIESGGRYDAVGPTHSKLGRALGKYQVMEANIPQWSQEALGRSVTPDEFLASPEIQDAIFDNKFGSYVQKYGPEQAAQAWFGGEGGIGKVNRTDSLGTKLGDYGKRFMGALGGEAPAQPQMQQTAQAAPQPMTDAGSGTKLQQLYQAFSSPYLNEQQRSVVGMMLQQEMQRNQPMDPLKQLQMQKLQQEVQSGGRPWYVRPDGTVDPAYIQAQQAGRSQTNVNVDTKGETEYDKMLGKSLAEKTMGIMDAGQAATGKMATYQQVMDILPSIYTGTGGESVLAGKRMLQSLGMDMGDLSGPEFVQAIGNQMALELRNPAGGAGMPGALSDKDREFLTSMSPGLTKTPEGNQKLLQYRMAMEQRNVDVARMANEYMNANSGRLDNNFFDQLSQWSAQNPLFPQEAAKSGRVGSISEMSDAELEAIINGQ